MSRYDAALDAAASHLQGPGLWPALMRAVDVGTITLDEACARFVARRGQQSNDKET